MAPARRLIQAALLAASMTAGASDEVSINVGSTARSYVIHLPNGREPAAPAALVLVLHGLGADAASAAVMSGMDAKADREGFIAVYPNGRSLSWNAWRCCGVAELKQFDDVRFIRAVVEKVAREHPIDRQRIYATGVSNGGMMAYRLACEAADVFAAIAPVAAAMLTADCRPPSPVSVIVFHGMADDVVPFGGGRQSTPFDPYVRIDDSVAFAVAFWAREDGCERTPAHDKRGRVIHDVYACPGGRGVELYAIEGLGHAWPRGEISAADLMWDFFAAHPKP